MTHDIYVLLGMAACGAALSVLFDLRRGIQKAVRLPDFIVIIADMLFWIIAAASAAWCIWVLNSGIIRIYEFIGLILGSVLYFSILSPVVLKFFIFTVKNILKIIAFIFKILLTPIRFLYKIVMVYILGIKTGKKEESANNERIKGKDS